MWEALLLLRLIASAVPLKNRRQVPLALPAGFFKDSIRLAYAAYRLSLPATGTADTRKNTGKNNGKKNIA